MSLLRCMTAVVCRVPETRDSEAAVSGEQREELFAMAPPGKRAQTDVGRPVTSPPPTGASVDPAATPGSRDTVSQETLPA
jgi:hypothetical protein